jgi:hypothetical protein
MTNQRLPAIVDYSNPVHHRAGGQVAADVGSLTFLATWGSNRPEPGHSYGGIGENTTWQSAYRCRKWCRMGQAI